MKRVTKVERFLMHTPTVDLMVVRQAKERQKRLKHDDPDDPADPADHGELEEWMFDQDPT